MAYQIDYTASNYASRSLRKALLRLLLVAALAGAAWSVYDCYRIYNQPTLNMKLAEYEAVARPIEEMNAAWDEVAREYSAMVRYYRLVWASNPTNFFNAMASADAPTLGRGFQMLDWTLTTGGECRLNCLYEFSPGDKAEQAKGIKAEIVDVVTSVVQVVEGRVDVQGVQTENLLGVDELDIVVRFSLPNVRSFPVKESALADCVKEIAAMRKKVQEAKFMKADVKGDPTTAQAIMAKPYIELGRGAKGLPDYHAAIDILGWLRNADKFVENTARNAGKTLPDDDIKRRQHLKDIWNTVGEARFPFSRFRELDNDELVRRTKALENVADGVRRFKVFLDKRRVDCRNKLEPFVEAYDYNDVFNKPYIASDLTNRVANAAGIARARVAFKAESGAEPVALEKTDEKFTFTWVRWTLFIGDEAGQNGDREPSNGNSEGQITLEKFADCVRRALELGPGYALEKARVNFSVVDGNVTGAVLEGLLPVKKTESKKGAANDVD